MHKIVSAEPPSRIIREKISNQALAVDGAETGTVISVSRGFIPDTASAWITLTALGVSLVLSAMWSGLRPAPAVAPLRDAPAGPRNGA